MTTLSALLAATDRKVLNGDEGRPSPIGPHLAKDVLLGTRLDELASLGLATSGNGASMIGVQDAAGYYAGAQVEAVLTAIGVQIGGDTDVTFNFTEANVCTDDTAVFANLEALDLKWGDLAAVATGEGAALVGIEDAEAVFTETDVEGALATLAGVSHRAVRHRRWEAFEDFFGMADTEAEHGWVLNKGTDAQALDPAIDTAQAGGVWQLVTGNLDGTVAADGSGMVWSDLPIQLDSAGGPIVVEFRIRIKTAITNISLSLGLTDATGLEEPFTNAADVITVVADDAVALLYDTDGTTDEWWLVAADSTVADAGNATTGTAPVADTWQIVRLEISADGATISAYFGDSETPALTLTGDVGVGPDVVLYPFIIACADTATPTSKTVDVDYCHVRGTR